MFSSCVIHTDCAACFIVIFLFMLVMIFLLFKELISEMERKMSDEAHRSMANSSRHFFVRSGYFQNFASKKSKRLRSAFTTEQISYLEKEFKKYPYIGGGHRKEISNIIKIPEKAVKIWFQNRRMKEKKESSNKEFESEYHGFGGNSTTKSTNEPLNNAYYSQSNSDYRCVTEQPKESEVKFAINPFAQITINVDNSMKMSENICSNNKPVDTPKEVVGVSSNNFSNSPFTATESSVTMNANPMAFQRVENNPSISIFKQKNIYNVPSGNQGKGLASNCPLTNSYNIDEDMPQDLSSRSIRNNLYSQEPKSYPKKSSSCPGLIPMHTQNSYQSSALPTGNAIWKPVNMVSTVSVPQSTAVSTNIPQNSTETNLVKNHVMNTYCCNCNCHGPFVQDVIEANAKAHPQYILAIPFSNPPK